jgi:hypothetical protein
MRIPPTGERRKSPEKGLEPGVSGLEAENCLSGLESVDPNRKIVFAIRTILRHDRTD